MNYPQEYLIERQEFVEQQVNKYEHQTGIKLDAHSRGTLRRLISEEYDFEMRQAIRQDSNTGRDDQ